MIGRRERTVKDTPYRYRLDNGPGGGSQCDKEPFMYAASPSNYDKSPIIQIDRSDRACSSGWDAIATELRRRAAASDGKTGSTVIAVECYQGVDEREVLEALVSRLSPSLALRTAEAMRDEAEIRAFTQPDVTDDRLFGYRTRLRLEAWFDRERSAAVRERIGRCRSGIVLVLGSGAAFLWPEAEILVYADMPRWEIQKRSRNGTLESLGLSNRGEGAEEQYRRGWFVDWRVLDRNKKPLLTSLDYLLDTTVPGKPVLLEGDAFRRALDAASRRPFRMVPYFDPGPWGGQWMKEVCGLDPEVPNYAWCIDCVMEDQSVLLGFGGVRVEVPAADIVLFRPEPLLGDPVHARFGDEFPIRFDFLDTMEGGNLSLQVHPLTEYSQQEFGVHYTQDESYYIMDAAEDACVYLGLKEGIDPEEMIRDLERAERGEIAFDAGKYAAKWPVKKHDHLLIPGGTLHCSGKNTVVLEVSSNIYMFTFKLWDWGRLGLDGRPRPINIRHGAANIRWERTERWTKANLVNRIQPVAEGPDWREERTGLHEREFIETRRHWFSGVSPRSTGGVERGSCHVLNLVEGREAVVESPSGAFEPFTVHYAETFVVPAAAGEYSVRPSGEAEGTRCATITAYVRTGL
jgi:hypothetical protein